MHVLVTGCTGFVGYHTAIALHRAGHKVRLGVRDELKMRRVFKGVDISLDDFAIGEVIDAEAVARSLEGVDAVVHCAALVSMEAKNNQLMMDTNLGGTRHVLGQAVDAGIETMVYVSSSSALFDPKLNVMTEEASLTDAKNGYGQSKRAADEYVRSLVEQGANIATTYPAGIIGPDDPGLSEGNGALAYFLNEMMVDTKGTTQNVDVRDLAAIHVKMLEQKAKGNYLVGGECLTWAQYIEMIELATGEKGKAVKLSPMLLKSMGILFDALKKVVPFETLITREAMNYALHYPLVDDSKVRQAFGDDLFRPLQDTVADTAQWLAEAGHVGAKWAPKA